MRAILIVLISLILSASSFAAIEYLGAEGYSGLKTTLVSGTSKTIFLGGTAGDTTNCPTSGLCDTCDLNNTFPCNERAISSNTNLKIFFKVNTEASFDSSTRIRVRKGSNSETNNLTLVSSSETLGAGLTLFAEVAWTTICGGTCSDFAKTSLYVGLDKGDDNSLDEKLEFEITFREVDSTEAEHEGTANSDLNKTCGTYEGLCGFSVTKGDKKVYLIESDLKIPSTYPNTSESSGVEFKGVRVYFSDVGFSSILPLNGYGSIDVDENGELGDRMVQGLENDVTYYFLLANEDEAGNVYRASPLSYLQNDLHSATPEAVIGLLEDQSCFIATAAFGSPFEKHVQDLREFRNQFLLTNALGKKFVDFYYSASPPLAQWIAQHEWARSISRVLLWPVWLVSKSFLNFGFIGTFLMFASLTALIILTNSLRKKRMRVV